MGRLTRRFAAGLTLAVLFTLLLAPVFAPPQAEAQLFVFDVPHTIETILHYIGRLYEIYQKGTQIANQVLGLYRQAEQLYLQYQALAKFDNLSWSDLEGILMSMIAVLDQTEGLHYAVTNIDSQFVALFPGWQPYSDATTTKREQLHRGLETARGFLSVTARNLRNLGFRNHQLARIKQQLESAQGHQQALEAGVVAQAFQAEEQLLLRQLLGQLVNLHTVQAADQINARAQAGATLERALAETAAATTQSPGFDYP